MQASIIYGGNYVTTKAGLTGITGSVTTFTTSNAQVASLGGKAIAKAAVSGGATPTTDGITGLPIALVANTGTVVLWCLDKDGNIKLVKGSTEILDAAGNFLVAPAFPALPATLVPFAYVIHKAGATLSGTFTVGSTNWTTTGMTHTVVDILTLPQRPQVS